MSIADKLTTIAENEVKVFNAGKEAEYNSFWDMLQENGKRYDYTMGFSGGSWNDETFKPKYDIKPSWACVSMFNRTHITDLEAALNRSGVILDLSNNANYGDCFAYSKITVLPEITLASFASTTYNMFSNCTKLHTIRKLTFSEGMTINFTDTFPVCTALTNVEFAGILTGSISLKDSPLSKASIESLIGILSDTATGKTVTLKSSAVEVAMPWDVWDELIATKPNWTFSLV